jgi:hypothetical protein
MSKRLFFYFFAGITLITHFCFAGGGYVGSGGNGTVSEFRTSVRGVLKTLKDQNISSVAEIEVSALEQVFNEVRVSSVPFYLKLNGEFVDAINCHQSEFTRRNDYVEFVYPYPTMGIVFSLEQFCDEEKVVLSDLSWQKIQKSSIKVVLALHELVSILAGRYQGIDDSAYQQSKLIANAYYKYSWLEAFKAEIVENMTQQLQSQDRAIRVSGYELSFNLFLGDLKYAIAEMKTRLSIDLQGYLENKY